MAMGKEIMFVGMFAVAEDNTHTTSQEVGGRSEELQPGRLRLGINTLNSACKDTC